MALIGGAFHIFYCLNFVSGSPESTQDASSGVKKRTLGYTNLDLPNIIVIGFPAVRYKNGIMLIVRFNLTHLQLVV